MTSYSHSHSDNSDTHSVMSDHSHLSDHTNLTDHTNPTDHTNVTNHTHSASNINRTLMEFIVFSKTKENGIYPINNIILRMMNDEQISELKDPTLIDHLMEELRLPQNPYKTNDETSVFIYLNKNNIDFFKNDIISFTTNKTFWFNPEIKLKTIENNNETSYYNFFWNIIKKSRKTYLDKSDWMFLNISDRKIVIPKEKKEKYAKLRQELRDINKLTDQSIIKGYTRYNYDSWNVNGSFLKKFEPLLLT